jgi:capsular exopolysaccharide synthesis family protein
MNDHSGAFPQKGPIAPYSENPLVAASGLREIALAPPRQSQINPGEVWRILVKWWWLIAGIVVACVLLALVLSLLIEPKYRAVATLEVNSEGVRPVEMGELQPLRGQDRDFINTQIGLLTSRAMAERVARGLNLGNEPSVVDPSFDGDRNAVAASVLEGSLLVEPVRESRLVKLKIVNANPALAAKIANSYAETFIRSSLERRYEANSYARNFLEQRIGQIRGRLEQSERQLVAYAKQQGIVTLSVDSGGTNSPKSEQSIDAATLVSTNNALAAARTERIAAEQEFRQASGAQATASVIGSPTVQALEQQRATLEAQYQQKAPLFQPDFPEMVRLRNQIDTLKAEIQRASGQVAGSSTSILRARYATAVSRERELAAKVEEQKAGLQSLRERSIQYTILQREVDTNRTLYDALLQRFKEVGVAGGVGMNVVSIVDRAQVPGAPFTPNLPLNVLIGLFAGIFIGFGSAFALEWMDDTIKTPDDVATKLKISPLGVVPAAPKGASVQEHLQDSRSQLSEAYQSVRTALQFSTERGMPRSLLITSTRAGEGKSTTALSLAHSSATVGAKVLLIDADLRKPTFRGSSSQSDGLSSLLSGSGDLEACIQPTVQEGLFLLPAGRIPPNPAELIAAGRFTSVLDRVLKIFDYVVVDGPPVLGLADVPLLSTHCEGTLIVIESGAIRRSAALNSLNRLRAVDSRVLGAILTKFSATKSGYGYGYGYGYGDDAYQYRETDAPKRQIQLLKSE